MGMLSLLEVSSLHIWDMPRKIPCPFPCTAGWGTGEEGWDGGKELTHKTNLMAVPLVFQKTKCTNCHRFLLTPGFLAFYI